MDTSDKPTRRKAARPLRWMRALDGGQYPACAACFDEFAYNTLLREAIASVSMMKEHTDETVESLTRTYFEQYHADGHERD